MSTQTKERGFTIIEVVLVLAIAALIFLMIFIALPALQRGQRDTARKQDANSVVSAINSWSGNHRGSLPTEGDEDQFNEDYVKNLNQYAQGTAVDLVTSAPDEVGLDQVIVVLGSRCNDNGTDVEGGTLRTAAVLVQLEASNATVCTDA